MRLDDSEFDQSGHKGAADDELDRFNAELSGSASGRMAKYLPEGHEKRAEVRAEKARKMEAQLTALEALLSSNPAYAKLYNNTWDKLRDAEAVTEVALGCARDAHDTAKDELSELTDKANTLPDGTKAFRNQNGVVVSEDGRQISGPELERIEWRENAPSYEVYLAKKQAVTDAQAKVDALLIYQTDALGGARLRLEDSDNPPDVDELKEVQRRIDEGMATLVEKRPEAATDVAASVTTSVGLPPPPK